VITCFTARWLNYEMGVGSPLCRRKALLSNPLEESDGLENV